MTEERDKLSRLESLMASRLEVCWSSSSSSSGEEDEEEEIIPSLTHEDDEAEDFCRPKAPAKGIISDSLAALSPVVVDFAAVSRPVRVQSSRRDKRAFLVSCSLVVLSLRYSSLIFLDL